MKGIENAIRDLSMKEEMTSSSRSRRSRTGSSRRPSHVLLKVDAVVGTHRNRTTAKSFNRNGVLIEVSFLLKHPPQQSILYVASDDLNPFLGPVILCSVDDLLLFCVNVGSKAGHFHPKRSYDYYVYRASSSKPSLDLLQSPPMPVFHRDDVGLLPHPDGRYTVASLIYIPSNDVYELQLYHSDTKTWTSRQLSVDPPQWDPLPKSVPMYCSVLLGHYTSAVLTIGGEGGTMAWVDLWRSILLCDVLCPDPSLRVVPIPLPSSHMSLNDGLGFCLDFAGHSRSISFNRDKGCLTLVHLERNQYPPAFHTAATRGPLRAGQDVAEVLGWELTKWSNSRMSNSLEDWHKEHSVQASDITIGDKSAVSQMLEDFRSLRAPPPPPRERSSDDEAAASAVAQAGQQQLELHNLSIYQPILCPNGEDDVVYLLAREKYLHPKAWCLVVDMKNQGTLKHVANVGNQDHPFCHRSYCLSRISKYTNSKTRFIKSSTMTDPDAEDEEESNYQAGAVE